jgi:hypothetical protein
MALILKRASASRTSGEWNDDDFDVLADGVVVVAIRPAQIGLKTRFFSDDQPDSGPPAPTYLMWQALYSKGEGCPAPRGHQVISACRAGPLGQTCLRKLCPCTGDRCFPERRLLLR